MSAINLRSVKREFSKLNYRPDVCHPSLIDQLENILKITGLKREYDTVLSNINTHTLINIIQHVCKVCYSDTCHKEMAISFFIFLSKTYTEHCVDDMVKRTITKCLKSCPAKWQPELTATISHQFVLIMENEHDLSETEYFLKTLNECCEKFPDFFSNCIGKVIMFLELNLRKSYDILVCENSPIQTISAIRCIHEGFRFFLTAYRKDVFSGTKICSASLNECFTDLLDSDHLPMETLFNCCLSIVYSCIYVTSALECWKICLEKFSMQSDLVKLGFCEAVLNTFTGEEMVMIEPDSKKSIFTHLYNIVMDISSRNLNDSSTLIASSRVLFVLSKQLCVNNEIIDLEKHQFECLINFLWVRLDHFLDGVRHWTRDTMINIMKIKGKHVLNEVLERLSICDKNSKAFIIVLMILSDKVNFGLIIQYLPTITENLIHLMTTNNSAVTIFINLMLNHYSTTNCKIWFNYWLCPLFKNTDELDIKHFETIITKAVELTPDVSNYINDLSNQHELSLKIHLICYKIEKKNYLANNDDDGNWVNQNNFGRLKKALHHKDEKIRFIAVDLILDCQKKTQPFTEKELELMKYFIIYNMKNEKASVKQKNLSFVKKMLLRMKESQFSVTVRNNVTLNTTITKIYTEFQHWFSDFCFHNLFPEANYSRRNFSLESLHLIQTCLLPMSINESKNVSILLNCIWDTYEQNKILAKDILTYKNRQSIKLDNIVIEDMLKTSKILASSTSPPNCITAGYLLELVIFLNQNTNRKEYAYEILMDLMNNLKKEVELAEENLTLASAKGPMYGLIHTIRHLLNTINWQTTSIMNNNWTTFIENMSTICLKCEKLVSVVVNDSSPEGIVPMDNLCQNDCQVTSQMVLLCCWRTTKESSLMLADIVNIVATQESEFSNALVIQICSCLTLLLSETKHRGAFEQIYVAYLKVCSVMWKSSTLHTIPLKYLEEVLAEIKTGLGEMFCVTRRSAGMPFIIQALICTNHDKRKIVNYTMEMLISICENKDITENLKIGVVHSMNVLRALFRCSSLGDLVGPFVSRAINISIVLFNSSCWLIRNSSTLLLSALVNRVFGVPRSSTEVSWKNRMTGREFFQRYPELYDTFLNEFKKFSPIDMRPSLYPTLLILARLYPSVNEATDCVFQLAVYIPYIFKCAQSPVMKTRMLAATSIMPQVTQNKLVEHLYVTYNRLTNEHLKENTIHGLLLQMFSLVEHLPKLALDDLHKLVTLTEDLLMKYDRFYDRSYVVQEVFLRCITCLWLQLDDLQCNCVKPLYTSTLESITQLVQSNAIGRSKYLESATLFLFSVSIKAKTDFSIIVSDILEHEVYCGITFEILNVILSEKQPVEYCDGLEYFKNLKYWNRKVLVDQLMANKNLIELICKQCTITDSLTEIKYVVLSNFTLALRVYFDMYESIDNFISKTFNLRKDAEIAHALLCINGHLCNLESLEQSAILKLTQIFENIYYAQRSDDCKNACIDIIVDNYSLFVKNYSTDVKIFLKLWTIIVHYSEDDSEEVRNHVWRLVDNDTNCAKSFELLFDKFAKHFDQFPAAVFVALICWSCLDVDLPQDRSEGQVFDGGDTSEFKEHTIRRRLALNMVVRLTNSHHQSMNMEISNDLKVWITEEWTFDFDVKPTCGDLKTVRDFMSYAEEFYSKIAYGLCKKISVFQVDENSSVV